MTLIYQSADYMFSETLQFCIYTLHFDSPAFSILVSHPSQSIEADAKLHGQGIILHVMRELFYCSWHYRQRRCRRNELITETSKITAECQKPQYRIIVCRQLDTTYVANRHQWRTTASLTTYLHACSTQFVYIGFYHKFQLSLTVKTT